MRLSRIFAPVALSVMIGVATFTLLGGAWWKHLIFVWLLNVPVTFAYNYFIPSDKKIAER